MYRITYEQGNGYHCGCCRRTYTDDVDLKTEEEVYQWLITYYADKKMPRYEDCDDRELHSIEKEIGVDFKELFFSVTDARLSTLIDVAGKARKGKNNELLQARPPPRRL